ncbi:MAG: hypothetical protein V5A14_02275 [Desulfohalobiaceae bacterium]
MTRKKKPSGPPRSREQKQSSPEEGAGASFYDLLDALVPAPTKEPPRNTTWQGAPLAHLEYKRELELKNRALESFWQQHEIPGTLESIRASPLPRHYRTTSKRRAAWRKGGLYLHLAGTKPSQQKQPFLSSPLEPESHGRIFRFLRSKISEPPFQLVARHLNHLIIRGSYAELAVIFNVDTLNGPLVRKLKLLAGHLQKMAEPIAAAFAYSDPSASPYYLEARQSPELLQLKRLFGRQRLMVEHHDCRFLVHPTSFSQVNESIVPLMLQEVHSLLAPEQGERLLDLYCGYGLFSHYLAPEYKQVVGVEAEGPSIDAARANKKLNNGGERVQFRSGQISAQSLEDLLPVPLPGEEAILLDPPKQGPKKGVLSALARREPGKVLHIHCNADLLPHSVREWGKQGYHPLRVVPMDMFPGTTEIEVLLAFGRE